MRGDVGVEVEANTRSIEPSLGCSSVLFSFPSRMHYMVADGRCIVGELDKACIPESRSA